MRSSRPRTTRRRPSPPNTKSISNVINHARAGATMHDPLPRVVLVPGLGLFGLGANCEGRQDRRRSRRSRGRRHHRRGIDRQLQADLRSRHVRRRILAARTGQARCAQARCRSKARSRSSPAPAAPSAQRPRASSRKPAPKWRCSISMRRPPAQAAKTIGGAALAIAMRRHRRRLGTRGLRAHGGRFRRRRYRHLQCRRRLAGQDRRGRRGHAAQELRIEFLRAPEGRAGRGQGHAGARHRRLSAVQRLQTGGQSGRQFRPLRPAQSGHAVPGAAICARLRRRRHPRQCGERRPHPLRPAHRRFHQTARAGARRFARKTT